MSACFVTTLDNPFDYFTQFDEWYAFDTSHGYDVIGRPYDTCNYVARIANTSVEMSENDYNKAIETAVDEICRLNVTGNYKKVYENEENKEKERKSLEKNEI